MQANQVDIEFARHNTKTGEYFHPGVTMAVYDIFGKPVSNFFGYWIVQKYNGEFRNVDFNNTEIFIPNHFDGDTRTLLTNFLKQIGVKGYNG